MVAFRNTDLTAELTLNENFTTNIALIPYYTNKEISSERMVTHPR